MRRTSNSGHSSIVSRKFIAYLQNAWSILEGGIDPARSDCIELFNGFAGHNTRSLLKKGTDRSVHA